MDYFNVCQLCRFCKKGSYIFQVKLSCYHDETGKMNVNLIELIRKYAFECEFCNAVSMVDFDTVCAPSCVLELKRVTKEKKQKMQQIIQQLISLLIE